jgi:hypothetical protein
MGIADYRQMSARAVEVGTARANAYRILEHRAQQDSELS